MTQQIDTQDQYHRDAEFRHEERHLVDVVAGMDRDIARREEQASRRIIGPDTPAADAATVEQKKMLEQVKAARDRPFFGRIDYSEGQNGEVRTIYIGRSGLQIEDVPNGLIVNWAAPIADLFYRPTRDFYDAPRGRIDTTVHLKRELTIEEARLQDFQDTLRLQSATLIRRLSSASSEYLSDAIETLQPEQYEALSKTASPVMIVQGAAGAGKSIVGLQRIQFILSPHSNIGVLGRPQLERIIMFGPSEAFLQYASELLPSLDVKGVQQSTVTHWMLGQFSSHVTLQGGEERVLNDLMNRTARNRRLNEAVNKAYKFKGRMGMKRLLDRYVSKLKRDVRRNIQRRSGNIVDSLQLGISVSEFRNMIDDAFSSRPELNAARSYLLDTLAEARARNAPQPTRRRNTSHAEVIDANRREVDRELNYSGWPEYDFRTQYVRLMADAEALQIYSPNLDWSEANEICLTVSTNASGRSLGITDLAAALYLDYALNGFTSQNFEHVVVDEAQDVTPLEMELLRMHSTNESFTILGDLKQGLLEHRSIENWNEFARLFQHAVAKQEMRLTYRSVKQITQYANRIVKDLHGRGTKTPQPYGRAGERPEVEQHRSAADMYTAIADAIDELRAKVEVRSIAVLTKWETTAKDIMKAFRSERMEGVSRLEQGGLIETDIIVSPILLTKGLEFDAVIVANASKNNFDETEFDRMLLYLACTRARHYLQIHWHGPRSAKSPIVPDTSRLAR